MVPNNVRKRIAVVFVEKLQSYSKNKERKQNFSSTYVPFFDRIISCKLIIGTDLTCVVASKKGNTMKAEHNSTFISLYY